MNGAKDGLYLPAGAAADGIWDVVHFLQALADPRSRRQLQLFDPSIKFEPQ